MEENTKKKSSQNEDDFSSKPSKRQKKKDANSRISAHRAIFKNRKKKTKKITEKIEETKVVQERISQFMRNLDEIISGNKVKITSWDESLKGAKDKILGSKSIKNMKEEKRVIDSTIDIIKKIEDKLDVTIKATNAVMKFISKEEKQSKKKEDDFSKLKASVVSFVDECLDEMNNMAISTCIDSKKRSNELEQKFLVIASDVISSIDRMFAYTLQKMEDFSIHIGNELDQLPKSVDTMRTIKSSFTDLFWSMNGDQPIDRNLSSERRDYILSLLDQEISCQENRLQSLSEIKSKSVKVLQSIESIKQMNRFGLDELAHEIGVHLKKMTEGSGNQEFSKENIANPDGNNGNIFYSGSKKPKELITSMFRLYEFTGETKISTVLKKRKRDT
jgi:hypothetical protein